MAITDPLVLPSDVVLAPVLDLPESVRGRLDWEEGDFILSRPRLRIPSRVLDAPSAGLVAEFRTPSTVVEAVLRFSREKELDPEATLTEAFPLLENLVALGFLVEEGSAEAGGIRPSLSSGDEVEGFTVLDSLQVVEDSEIHQARCGDVQAVLKVERLPGSGGGAWAREAAILRHLDGSVAPRFLGEGQIEGRRWLALERWPGVEATTVAAELRRLRPGGDRAGLLVLCRALVAAYAGLHERGVVHGDVHPRNVLVASDLQVRLVDFGLARWDGGPTDLAPAGRGGIGFFFEPEYALAVCSGSPAPAPSPAGEQHALAALLYLLLTGAHYRDFSLERAEMLRQIAEDPPLSFAARETEPWPEMESILARALSKAPGERFASVAELGRALERLAAPEPRETARDRRRPALVALEALWEQVRERFTPGGDRWPDRLPDPPRASVQMGAAGIAHAFYRAAMVREDPEDLALADHWAVLATAQREEDGFSSEALGITPATVGHASVWHAAAGVWCVRALTAHALGDLAGWREAVRRFQAEAVGPCSRLDLTLGRSGLLLAAALLLEVSEGEEELETEGLLWDLGGDLLAALWRDLDEAPAIPDDPELPNLGMAHGWAGYLYATLRWCRASGAVLPAGLAGRLAELASCGHGWGRGMRWRWQGTGESRAGDPFMPGWCNGSAGFVYLWSLAHRVCGEERWARLAESAAWNAWEAPERGGDLCCGLAGRAYALLEIHRHGGGPEWLARARDLAGRAAQEIGSSGTPDSLYKGELGPALLALDLERPEAAAMPFFGEEGWLA